MILPHVSSYLCKKILIKRRRCFYTKSILGHERIETTEIFNYSPATCKSSTKSLARWTIWPTNSLTLSPKVGCKVNEHQTPAKCTDDCREHEHRKTTTKLRRSATIMYSRLQTFLRSHFGFIKTVILDRHKRTHEKTFASSKKPKDFRHSPSR